MSIKDERWNSPATKGDVAGVALKAGSIIIIATAALEKTAKGQDISSDLAMLDDLHNEIMEIFDDLTGWETE